MNLAKRVAARSILMGEGLSKFAGPLTDVSRLRYQAVFLMGAGGSGKGFVGQRWLKWIPGSGPLAQDKVNRKIEDWERGLKNLEFEKVVDSLARRGVRIEPVAGGRARIPFKLYSYDSQGRERLVAEERWEQELPPVVFDKVKGLTEMIFGAPKHEVPSFWRQVNPDLYKEEIPGYLESQPGWVHEMSSDMSKALFEAAVQTGDPLFVDGTGASILKMQQQIQACMEAGYRVSLVLVIVPLTVNQIRNATRPRKVDPDIVASQWLRIKSNFSTLRKIVDKSSVVINRNDTYDIRKWGEEKDQINDFIRRTTEFADLRSLIEHYQPSELSDWNLN